MYNNICDENKLLAKQNQELLCNEKKLEEENKELLSMGNNLKIQNN